MPESKLVLRLFDVWCQIQTWRRNYIADRPMAVSDIGRRKSSQSSMAPRVHPLLVWGEGLQTQTSRPTPKSPAQIGAEISKKSHAQGVATKNSVPRGALAQERNLVP